MPPNTKDKLIAALKAIAQRGWIKNTREGNDGGVGNTLEDLLGIEENNLPIPNLAEWELKTQRANTTSLTTLMHTEPSPRAIKFVPQLFLPNYGWPHRKAGTKYPDDEKSFRQTIHANSSSDRGFMVKIDRKDRKILISFDHSKVAERHADWLKQVEANVGLDELSPQPYWGFDDLGHAAGTKLLNCFYVQAQVRRQNKKEFYHYNKVTMLQKFSFEGMLEELNVGNILIDFDARTGHNHGTKFRMKQNCLPNLYEQATAIL